MKHYKVLYRSFLQMLSQIRRDPMLVMSLIAPSLAGALFKFIIPALETFVCKEFNMNKCIQPYYVLFDLFLTILAPTMFCFASAMVILMEVDDKIANYYFVTPVGKQGYLIGRLLFPTILGGIYSMILFPIFNLTHPGFALSTFYIVVAALMSSIVSLLVIALSSNKVEGMAMTKLAGLLLIGLIVPFFVKHPIQYVTSILPSFWLGKFALDHTVVNGLLSIVLSFLWIGLLAHHFERKLVS
ncbi:MAG: ABC transporter permease [Clostridiales bacterium]|nr:ABC transporter permease [Clostridiales bacterium]